MEQTIKRELYLERIRPFYENELIKVLIGIRRCGKSVLLKQIMEEIMSQGVKKDQIIYTLKISVCASRYGQHRLCYTM